MVEGIKQFSSYFKEYNDRYILIGDAACYLVLNEVGLAFKAIQDIDIVLCLEAMNAGFAETFWDFINFGRYKNTQKSTGKKLFYRYYYREDDEFPYILGLFSSIPDVSMISDGTHLNPILVGEEQYNHSTIRMEEGYFNFVHSSKIYIDGVPTIPPEVIVPLKAKAFLDLINRRDTHRTVDRNDLKEYKKDIFRLLQIIDPATRVTLPDVIKYDIKQFLELLKADPPKNFKPFGLGSTKLDEIIILIHSIYRLPA